MSSDVPKPRPWQILTLTLVYILTRIAALHAGLHFDTFEVATYWQFLDTNLLRDHLFQSLLYLHAQPPLMNAFFGVLLKAFPTAWPTIAYLLYCAIGLCAWLALFTLALRHRVPSTLALIAILLALCNPSALLFEAQPLYTHIVFCLLAFAAFFFDRFLETRATRPAAALLATLTVLVLWRSSYQPLWFVLIALWIIVLARHHNTRRVITAAAICLTLIAALIVKNGILMGSWNTSSWSGMSEAKAWTWTPHPEIASLVARGKLSPISAIQSYRPLDDYAALIPLRAPTGIPALDTATRDNHVTNYNNATYIDISRAYSRDYLRVWRYSPRTILAFSIQGWIDYLKPASQYIAAFDPANEAILEPIDRPYRLLFCCRTLPIHSTTSPTDTFHQRIAHALHSICWPAAAIIAILLVMLVCPPFLRWTANHSPNTRPLLYFLILNVAYSAFLANLLEEGENMRFRYETSGLVLIATLILVSRCLKAIRRNPTPAST